MCETYRDIEIRARGDRVYVPSLERHFPNAALAREAIDLALAPKPTADSWLRDLAHRAIVHGGAILGHYRTSQGNIPIYLTTERPKNMTEWAHELRIPPPSKL